MKTNHKRDLTPPKNWQDFEDLCLGLWRPRLLDAKKHGRTGQPQAGVDVFGHDLKTGGLWGIQCKQRGQWPPKVLTFREIEAEVREAERFKPALSHFIVATTAQRDGETQQAVLQLNADRRAAGKFSVELYAWDDLVELLEQRIEESGLPTYTDEKTRALGEALAAAQLRHEELTVSGRDATEALTEILDLRRQIREGGQLQPGDFLADGRFRLLELIGKGGFSTVFKAYDRRTRHPVAVKVLHGQYARDETRRERFFRGARKMSEL